MDALIYQQSPGIAELFPVPRRREAKCLQIRMKSTVVPGQYFCHSALLPVSRFLLLRKWPGTAKPPNLSALRQIIIQYKVTRSITLLGQGFHPLDPCAKGLLPSALPPFSPKPVPAPVLSAAFRPPWYASYDTSPGNISLSDGHSFFELQCRLTETS